jgi:hypothetical protein
MKFKPDTLASAHEQMALVKTQSTGGFFTNYFRHETALVDLTRQLTSTPDDLSRSQP